MVFVAVPHGVKPQSISLLVYNKIDMKGIPVEYLVLACTDSTTLEAVTIEVVPFILEMLQV